MEKKYRFTHLFCLFFVRLSLAFVMVFSISFPCRAGEQLNIRTHSVAVMPFFTGEKPADAETVLDLRLGQLGTRDVVMPGAEEIMTGLVQQSLEKRLGDGVLSLEEVAQVYEKILAEGPDQTPKDLVLKLGERLGVDYVVAGNVWRFTEREGSALAVGKPASVAFKLHVIDVSKKTRIWAEPYDETQQSLSENLFKVSDFIKQKGQWVKVDALAEIGVDKLVKKMPF